MGDGCSNGEEINTASVAYVIERAEIGENYLCGARSLNWMLLSSEDPSNTLQAMERI